MGTQMRDELNPEYLSSCVMKRLMRGELARARYYLERLMELPVVPQAPQPPVRS